jgi:hypothetical protein
MSGAVRSMIALMSAVPVKKAWGAACGSGGRVRSWAGDGHRGDLVTAVALAVWGQGLALVRSG